MSLAAPHANPERASDLLGLAHVAHFDWRMRQGDGAPQNALYGLDVILPLKRLGLLMFQARAASQHAARGWRVAHAEWRTGAPRTRSARDM
jgi:hypothetical protein